MKTKPIFKPGIIILVSIVAICWSACNPPEMSVEQAEFTESNSSFNASVEIFRGAQLDNGGTTVVHSGIEFVVPPELLEQAMELNNRAGNTLYLGIKLPLGWRVIDSIPFKGDMEQMFVYSAKRSNEMERIEHAGHGFYWWVGETTPPIPFSNGRLHCYPEIMTNDTLGNFYLDYMLGYNGSLNTRRCNDLFINIGIADTVWVTSSQESGPGSIREAIDLVKPGGLILFDFNHQETIYITEQIRIYKDVTIHGPELEEPVFTSENLCRILFIGKDTEVRLSNILLCYGKADMGGGIFCSAGSVLDLENVTVKNSSADIGGGIYCDDHSIVKFENCNIINNKAFDRGGGIYFLNSSAEFDSINRSNIYLNQAGWSGNDLFSTIHQDVILDTFTVLYPSTFHAEPLNNFSFDILNGKIDLINADLFVSPSGNDLNSGLNENEPLKTIRFACSRIVADSLHQNKIHLSDGTYGPSSNQENFPIVMMDYISFIGETERGSILDAEGQCQVLRFIENRGNHISEITITGGNNTFDEFGGGIYCESSNPILQNVTIKNNHAVQGGGIYYKNSSPELIEVSITHNTAQDAGGGIFCDRSQLVMEHVNIRVNSAIKGGGLYCNYSAAEGIDINISDNTVTKYGGGIYFNSNSEWKNFNVSNNSAYDGAGIYSMDCDPVLTNGTISNNYASNKGGGIYCYNSNPGYNNLYIIHNHADFKGGGLYCKISNPILQNVLISNNSSSYKGGGILLYKDCNALLKNVTLSSNTALRSGGGGHCSLGSELTLINSILWNNSPEEVCFLQFSTPSLITVHHSDIQGGQAGIETNGNGYVNWLEGNKTADPLFCGSGEYPCALLTGFPCIDAGTPDTTGLNLPAMDLIGNNRLVDGDGDGVAVVDMGAYEFVPLRLDNKSYKLQATSFKPQATSHKLQVFPNPTFGISDIRYQTPTKEGDIRFVLLEVLDIHGQRIRTLVSEQQGQGEYLVRFDGSDLPAGVYLIRLHVGTWNETVKVVVMR